MRAEYGRKYLLRRRDKSAFSNHDDFENRVFIYEHDSHDDEFPISIDLSHSIERRRIIGDITDPKADDLVQLSRLMSRQSGVLYRNQYYSLESLQALNSRVRKRDGDQVLDSTIFGDFFVVFLSERNARRRKPHIIYPTTDLSMDEFNNLKEKRKYCPEQIRELRKELQIPYEQRVQRRLERLESLAKTHDTTLDRILYLTNTSLEKIRTEEDNETLERDLAALEEFLANYDMQLRDSGIFWSRNSEEGFEKLIRNTRLDGLELGREIRKVGRITQGINLIDLVSGPDDDKSFFRPLFHNPAHDDEIRDREERERRDFERRHFPGLRY